MPAKLFDVPDIGTIRVYKRKGSRNIRLSVTSDGVVRVTMPSWLPYRSALTFVRQKQSWIQQNNTKRLLHHQQVIGIDHKLYFTPHRSSTISSQVGESTLTIFYPSSMTFSDNEVQEAAHVAAKKALKKQAIRILPGRLESLAEQTGHTYKSVSIRHLKTRWGSCNSNQEITLNYYLMQLPWELIDYVLVHELSHTVHMNHSQQFWEEVAKFQPRYKEMKKQIKQYQPSIISG